MDLIGSDVEKFTDFMQDLEKENLRYIQILQVLEEDISLQQNKTREQQRLGEKQI